MVLWLFMGMVVVVVMVMVLGVAVVVLVAMLVVTISDGYVGSGLILDWPTDIFEKLRSSVQRGC